MKLSNSCQTIQSRIKRKKPKNLLLPQKKQIFYINILKNQKIILDNIKSMRSRNESTKNNNKFLTVNIKSKNFIKNSRNSQKTILPKICPYSYRYFFKEQNKHFIHKSSNNVNSIENSKNKMESNFMKIGNESNIYTSNVKYISNKKMVLLDKYKFDNNLYKPDRLKIYDMSTIIKPQIKLKNIVHRNKLYSYSMVFNNNNSELSQNISDL